VRETSGVLNETDMHQERASPPAYCQTGVQAAYLGELERCSAEAALVSPWPILSRPQSLPAPFSAFPSQWYRARVLAEAVQEDHCRGPGASTPQALQYTARSFRRRLA
jgi:hypothetical protein